VRLILKFVKPEFFWENLRVNETRSTWGSVYGFSDWDSDQQ
jgi:hypothetical protein